MKSLKIFTIWEICPANHLKAGKKSGLQKYFPLRLQFCDVSLHLQFGLMFVFHVDTFKSRAMLAPRSRAVKKPYGASIRYYVQQIILGVEIKFHCMSAQSEPMRRLNKIIQ